MFEKVLFPTDFSVYADKTLECGYELKELGVKEVTLIHVIDRSVLEYVDAFYGADTTTIIEDVEEKAKRELEKRVKMLEQEGIKAGYTVAVGDPATEIVNAARGFSAILIGAKGRGALSSAFIGSVSESVIKESPVPVLVTKLKVVKKEEGYHCELIYGKMFEKVLYATDFSEDEKKIECIKEFPSKKVIVLHVLEHGEDKEDAALKLKKIGEKLNAEHVLRDGKPCKEILKVAEDLNCTIVVMGRAKESGLFGTTVDCVLRRSGAPIFIL